MKPLTPAQWAALGALLGASLLQFQQAAERMLAAIK
jgi:hypothetical protein